MQYALHEMERRSIGNHLRKILFDPRDRQSNVAGGH
jgi:hypothetical protein